MFPAGAGMICTGRRMVQYNIHVPRMRGGDPRKNKNTFTYYPCKPFYRCERDRAGASVCFACGKERDVGAGLNCQPGDVWENRKDD